jgi:hypothetical protein
MMYRWTPVEATGVSSISGTEVFSMYPNPSCDKIHLAFTNVENSTNAQINILDIAGRELLTQNFSSAKGKNNIDLNIQSLAKGIYMIRINNLSPVKFIKE